MVRVSLRFFASRVLRTKSMDEGDRKTLERVIFSDGVRSRIEAEVLLQLAGAVTPADPAWTDFVVSSIVDFVVWGERPTGYVDRTTANWLVAVLSQGGGNKLARRIAQEIMKEAQDVDPRLADFAHNRWLRRFKAMCFEAVSSRGAAESHAWAPA